MKGIIIYKSNYGSTQEYARWLNEDTGFPAIKINKVKEQDIKNAEIVILGSPIMANKPFIAGWIQKKWNILQAKKIILYTTSGTYAKDPVLQKGFEESFEPNVAEKIAYFPQGGRMIVNKLNFFHKLMMNIGKKIEKDPKVREEMGKDKDNVDRKGLKALLKYINKN